MNVIKTQRTKTLFMQILTTICMIMIALSFGMTAFAADRQIEVPLTSKFYLWGDIMQAGDFTFNLEDKRHNVIQTTQNKAEEAGKDYALIEFNPVFTEPGEYIYSVRWASKNVSHILPPDDASSAFRIVISETQSGELEYTAEEIADGLFHSEVNFSALLIKNNIIDKAGNPTEGSVTYKIDMEYYRGKMRQGESMMAIKLQNEEQADSWYRLPREQRFDLSPGDTFTLNNGELLYIPYMFDGMKYNITPVTQSGYTLTDSVNTQGSIPFDPMGVDQSVSAEFTHTYSPLINIHVEKIWSDAWDKNEIRPDEIVVALTDSRTGTPVLVVNSETGNVMTLNLNPANNWNATFYDAPFYPDSVLTVVELDENGDPADGSAVDGYEMFVTGDEVNGYQVENRYISDNVINTVFQKYLLLDANANVPNKTFTYTVAPGQARSYDLQNGRFEVYAGIGQPTVGQAVFSPSMTAYDSRQGSDMITLGSSQKYAKAGVAIDFTGISFPEPGVYRYVLTELDGSDASVQYDVQKPDGAQKNIRILDVYVNNTHGERDEYNWPKADYTVAGMVLHANDEDVRMGERHGTVGGTLSDKSDGYVNAFSTVDLTVGKEVDGNQASRDKYFAVTVKLENAIPGTIYSVDLTNADARISANPTSSTTCITENVTQPERLTVGNDGSVQQVFYLQGSHKVVIRGIEPGTKYTVSENEEDYKPSIAVEGDTTNNEAGDIASVNGRQVSDKSLNDTTTVTLTNTRDGVIPTGTHSAVWPFIMLAVIGGLGLAVRRMETL